MIEVVKLTGLERRFDYQQAVSTWVEARRDQRRVKGGNTVILLLVIAVVTVLVGIVCMY